MRRLVAIIGLLALLTFSAGCADAAEADEVRESVRAYNDALVAGLSDLDMNALSGTATREQAQREYSLMAALGESRVRMLATVVDIEFGEVEFPAEDRASVTTTETWDYRHESLDTSETVREERGVVYHLRYDLVRQDGVWLVSGVTSLDDVEPSAEGTAS
ncbi:MAG: hypothetical protein Kow0067_06790 [Coriobacteriia bacterium]|jgi:hypothetical protein